MRWRDDLSRSGDAGVGLVKEAATRHVNFWDDDIVPTAPAPERMRAAPAAWAQRSPSARCLARPLQGTEQQPRWGPQWCARRTGGLHTASVLFGMCHEATVRTGQRTGTWEER